MSLAADIACNLSCDAIAQARAVIQALAALEPDLDALPKALETIPFNTFVPDRRALAWRGLYLSIYQQPKRVVLVGSIDHAPELAGLADDTAGLLIVETDAATVSTAGLLPRGTQWRSLTEFEAGLDAEDRIALATALINGLQPDSVLILGSRAGLEMLVRYGRPLHLNTALCTTLSAVPDLSIADLFRTYLVRCIPVLTAIYGPDQRVLQRLAELFGLSGAERAKLRDWRDDHGLLDAPGGRT
jgi:hypothetical protein